MKHTGYFTFQLFGNNYCMTGEPTHTASKERNGTVHPSYINYHPNKQVTVHKILKILTRVSSIIVQCRLIKSTGTS